MASKIKRRRFANGPHRPKYLSANNADLTVMMILALASELSALRERLDTHERLAAAGRLPEPSAVESYTPDEHVEVGRAAARRSFIERVTRVLLEPDTPRVCADPRETNE